MIKARIEGISWIKETIVGPAFGEQENIPMEG
jgi:hypothetical protein